ncbi:hypothetical protein GCM10017635_11710 [Paracoccus kondratievae]|uniref:Uncharacterized protein n=1 Tax=Paracoccus kondratievae TaxID=135740 RepID=A0AAD3NXC9_9RHOB|nr:hypothetical protein GCM10017635_11710 [Paracoccus kondratievae]
MVAFEAGMGGLFHRTGCMAGRHGHDPENLDVSIFGQPKLMFVTLYRMRRVSKFEIVSLSPWMTDIEKIDEAGLGGPALAAAGTVALAPADIGHRDPLLMSAVVTIESIGRIAFRIAVEACPAETQRLLFFAMDETGLAARGNCARRNTFNEGELAPNLVATGREIAAVMPMPGIPAEPGQAGGGGGCPPAALDAMRTQGLRGHEHEVACHMEAPTGLATQRDTEAILNAGDQGEAFAPRRFNPMGMQFAMMNDERKVGNRKRGAGIVRGEGGLGHGWSS